MKPRPNPTSENLEQDPVWDLLEQATPRRAGPRFADNVVRRARLDEDRGPPWWWVPRLAPLPATAFAAAAALAIGLFVARQQADGPAPALNPPVVARDEATAERMAHLQEVLETEMLFVAVENMDEFSDAELITLIGF